MAAAAVELETICFCCVFPLPYSGTSLVPTHSPSLALQDPVSSGSARSPSSEEPCAQDRGNVCLAADSPDISISLS